MPTTMTLDGVRMNRFVAFLKNLGPRPKTMGDVYLHTAREASRALPATVDQGTIHPQARLVRSPHQPHQLLGDAWSDDAVAAGGGSNAIADFTVATVGWGILAFAVGTAAIRGYRAVSGLVK